MSEKSVAYRYAKSLIDLAEEQKVLDEVNNDMYSLRQTCKENSELLAVLQNPIIRGHKKFAILKEIFADKINPLTLRMFEVLSKKNRETILYAISEQFNHLYNEYKGIEEVQIITTISMSESLKEELKAMLTKKLNKKIHLQEKVNPALIGGFIIKVGNSQIDNSIKNNLQRLKQNFVQKLYN